MADLIEIRDALRDLPAVNYDEHVTDYRSGAQYGSVSYRRPDHGHDSLRTGSADAHSPVTAGSGAGNEARGLGSGSRMLGRGELPAAWIEEPVPKYPNKKRWWRSAEHKATGNKPLRSWPAVQQELVAAGTWDKVPEAPIATGGSTWRLAPAPEEDEPPPPQDLSRKEKNRVRNVQWRKDIKEAEAIALEDVGHATYLVQKSQVVRLMTVEVRKQCKCRTRDCEGHFEMTKCTTVGHGGSLVMWFRCNGEGCARNIVFHGSEYLNLDRTFTAASDRFKGAEAVGFMEVVISLLNGELHHSYEKAIKRRGANPYGATYFNDIIAWLYPYVERVLDRQCDSEIELMKSGLQTVLGSAERAVTTADGFWQIPGFHSPNGSGVVVNYLTGALLAYGHLCQRGKDPYDVERVCDCENACEPYDLMCDGKLVLRGCFGGSAKMMESTILYDCFAELQSKGIHVEKNIEDGDGGSDKSFSLVYSGDDSHSLLCGNHAGRACLKRAKQVAGTKSWRTTDAEKKQSALPITDGLKCHCTGNHSPNCGCIKDNLYDRLRLNITLAMIKAEHSPAKFTEIMEQVIRHTTSDCETCTFHPPRVCSCELKCESSDLKCVGKPYEVPYRVTCPYHARALERVLRDLIAKAPRLVDEELGRIVSNLPEKYAWVVKGFRNKEHVLQALHYKLKTNMGLMQGNGTAMARRHGESYHWMLEVLGDAKLPIPEDLPETCKKQNQDRLAALAKSQEPEAKRKRIEGKATRSAKAAERSAFGTSVRLRQEGRAAMLLGGAIQYNGGGNFTAEEAAGMEVDMGEMDGDDEGHVAALPGSDGYATLESRRAAREAQQALALQQLKQRVAEKGHQLVTKVPVGGGGAGGAGGSGSTGGRGRRGAGAAAFNGIAGNCTCNSKCKTVACPCKAASPPIHCTPNCKRCPHPGSECCNNSTGAPLAMTVELTAHESPTPANVTFEGEMSLTALPVPCVMVMGDLETSGCYGVYENDVTQMCFKARLLTAEGMGAADLAPEMNTYVKTEQRIPEWCAELTGIVSASNPDSPLRGAPTFKESIGRLMEMVRAARAAEGVPADCPVVLAGHNFLQFDIVALVCQSRREEIDLLGELASAGVVGLVDSLHVARGVTAWPVDEETNEPRQPLNPDTAQPSLKLGACYTALGYGMLMNAHDAGADVEANVCVLASDPFLQHMRANACMYGFEQCVLRARTLRQRHANLPSASKERVEVELLVQQFAETAPAASRLSLPPAPKNLRGAAHGEAKRLGIQSTHGGDEAAGTRCVVLVQVPCHMGD